MNDALALRGSPRLSTLLQASAFLDSIRTGILVQDTSGEVVDYNAAAVRLLGLGAEHAEGRHSFDPWRGAVKEDGTPFAKDELPAAVTLRTGETQLDVVVGVDLPGQIRRWLSVDTYLLTIDDTVTGVVAAFDDIDTQWHERHLLKLLAEVNRVVVSTSSEAESLQHLCTTLVERGPYALAWIGMTDAEDDEIRPTFSAGATGYLYPGMTSRSDAEATGLGPSGTAIRTGVTQVANDLATQPGFEPWRERAARFGLRSSLAIPFQIGEHRAGLFVYADAATAFDEATVRGLEQIAKEVGFGIAYVRSVRQSEEALEATITAINAQRETEHALTESEQRFRLAFENNMAPMSFSDDTDRMIAVNDAFCTMVGYARDELIGADTTHFTLPEDVDITQEALRRMVAGDVDHLRYVQRYLRKDHRIIVSEVARSAARDDAGRIRYFVLSERDVTEERELTEQLSHQAFHDPLTGLANRALFDDRLAQAHARIVRRQGTGAVLLLDLDDFKGVNDTHGHLVGDQLLIGIARRFEVVTRETDTLCRFGGDEFLYLAEELGSPWEAEDVARRLLDALAEPFTFGGASFVQHASLGIVLLDGSSTDCSESVQDADVALYEAKRQHRGSYAWFTPSMHQRAVSRFTVIQELRHALHNGELSMHYQPVLDLRTSEIVGFEALMRWQHPERGWIPPDSFISLAEQSDLIVELGAFALREAIQAAASWPPGTGDPPFVSVNLSAHQFFDPNLLPMIEAELEVSGLAPDRLILEITESVAMLDTAETLAAMQHLNRLGIGIALDDFGTGYSSLSYLAMLHPRIIKIDQSFVRPLHDSEQNDLLLETIVSLGAKLNMTMLAEGIETSEQLDRLRRTGCELGQGFAFSPAVPVGELPLMLLGGSRPVEPKDR
ncbi:MAG TPA: EAL domain-containing protein [Acidimicrobiales bacterium]|nr:EAL domain-containing protein [Acidimicrobiales bacterium]